MKDTHICRCGTCAAMGRAPPHPDTQAPSCPDARPSSRAFEPDWEPVPRGPITRELALGTSGVAQAVPALVDTLITTPSRASKGEGGGAFLSPALNVTLLYIPENFLRGLGSRLGWVGCVTLGKLLTLSGPQFFFF